MPNALAGIASLLWGCADFFGGIAARGWGVQRVGVVAQSVGLAVVALALLFVPADPSANDLLWGVAAGVASAIGLATLYRSLAIGPMNVAAPTTAVVGAAVPTAVGLIGGERPGPWALLGVLLAVVAVALVGFTSAGETERRDGSGPVILLAASAGLSLGVMSACFAQTSTASGLWPVGTARLVASVLLAGSMLVVRGAHAGWPTRGVKFAVAAGAADVGATISIALALQRGSLILVGVLGSLFPVATVLLARFVLRETIGRAQFVGLGCAVVAVALITLA